MVFVPVLLVVTNRQARLLALAPLLPTRAAPLTFPKLLLACLSN